MKKFFTYYQRFQYKKLITTGLVVFLALSNAVVIKCLQLLALGSDAYRKLEFSKHCAKLFKIIKDEYNQPLLPIHKNLLKKYVPLVVPVLLLSSIAPIVYIHFIIQKPLPMTLVKKSGQALSYRGEITQEPTEKYTLDLSTKKTTLNMTGISTAPEDVMIYIDEPNEADKNIITDVLFVDDKNLQFETASIELTAKSDKKINAILTCPSWDFDPLSGTCAHWQISKIAPQQTGRTIAFTVDHFSAYAGAYLELLNVQTNLTVGNIWEVRFNTYGQSNLTIQAIEGTEYGIDVEFVEFYCGATKLPAEVYDGNKVFIENYSCDGQLSRLVDRSVTPGPHKLQFTYGETTTVARNFACNVGTLDDTCQVSSANVMTNGSSISGSGNLVIKSGGSLTTSAAESFSINMGGNVTIESGGTITGNVSDLVADNLDIQLGGSINLNTKGSASTSGTGQGTDGSASNGAGGAGYGGAGGNGNSSVAGGAIFGSYSAPTDFGSGGGAAGASAGGIGGGAVRVTVSGTTTVAGTISVNGGNGGTSGGTNLSGAGGSGGSVYITTGTLAGAGSITAAGGNGANQSTPDGGGGGGGRIALYYTTKTHNGTVQANGGTGSDGALDGAAGTVYEKPSGQAEGILTWDNASKNAETKSQLSAGTYSFHTVKVLGNARVDFQDGVSLTATDLFDASGSYYLSNTSSTGTFTYPTPFDLTTSGTNVIIGGSSKWAFQDITVSSGTLSLNGSYSIRNLTVATGTTLTHEANSTAQTYDLQITASGDVAINGTGTISANSKGHTQNNGTGKGTSGSSSNGAGGAGYGGAGGNGHTGFAGGIIYGDVTAPLSIGSGGGSAGGSPGGAGGGYIRLNVTGTTTVSGSITANGANGSTGGGSNLSGGAGSGGGIYLTSGVLAGSGSIVAEGGAGANQTADGGGGGGGRIALYYTNKTFDGTLRASGGTGSDSALDGAAGTIYEKPSAQTYANLTWNNNSKNPETSSQLEPGTYTFNTIAVTGNARLGIQDGITLTATSSFSPSGGFYLTNTSTTGTFTYPTLDITSSGTSTIVGGTSKWPIRDVTISSGTLSMNGSYSIRNLTVETGTTLTHDANTTAQTNDLQITASGDVAINGTGTINVTGKGYSSSNGPGQGTDGTTSNGAGGAGHGGTGGNGDTGVLGGSSYGDSTDPDEIGSGGGAVGASAGGTGGGYIKLAVSGTTTLSGTLTASGNNGGTSGGSNLSAGGGSGGTIYVTSGTLAGSGNITANGGNGANQLSPDGGGGAGGRILVFANSSSYGGTVSASGGTGPNSATDGGAGSTYTDYSEPTVTINAICSTDGNTCTGAGSIASPQETYSVTSITGTSNEPNTTISNFKLAIKDSTDSLWYNPNTNAFDQADAQLFDPTTNSQTLPYTGEISWSLNVGSIPFEIDHTYQVRVDSSNPKITNTETLDFVFTNSPPTVSNVTASQNSSGTVTVGYDVTDNETASTTIYLLYDVGTTLSSGTDTGTGSISVSDAANFPTSGTILLDDELITYTSKSGNSLTGTITRGALNTIPAVHNSSQSVWLLSSNISGNAGTVSNGTNKSLTWTAKTDLNGFYSLSTRVAILSNDGASSSMVDSLSSSAFALDVKNPTWSDNFSVDASVADPLVTIPCADDSTLQMKVGLTADVSDVTWTTYAGTATIGALGLSVSNPFTIYGQCKDAKNNISTILTATTPETPSGMFFQDVSNSPESEWREFVTWNTVAEPSAGFNRYVIYRKVDSGAFAQLTTISDKALNYVIDTNLDTASTYTYKVVTEDDQGNISYFSSSVSDKPEGVGGSDNTAPTLTAVTAATVSSTQATITWNTNELANSKVYYEANSVYPGSNTASYDSSVTVESMVTSHTVTLSNLTPGTKYYFLTTSNDASANNGSSASGTYTFTTTDGPVISTVSTISVFDSEATIAWQTNVNASSTVKYSTNSDLSSSTTVNRAGSDTTNHQVALTGLTANTKYYFQVQSSDSADNETIEKNVQAGSIQYYTFTTTNDEVGPVISSVQAALVGQEGITVTWQTNEVATSQLLWGETSDVEESTVQTNVYTNFHSVTITSLTPETTYYYKVVSVDKSGNSTTSSPVSSATTDEVVTSGGDNTAPTFSNIDVTSITSNSAVVTWISNENADSFVKYGTASNNLDTTLGRVEAIASHSVTLNNLEGSTTYYFAVIGRDADGNNGESTTASFTTKATTNEELEAAADEDSELISLVVSIVEKASKGFLEKVLGALIKNPSISSLSEDQVVTLVEDLSEKSISAPTINTTLNIEPAAQTAVIKWTTSKPANSLIAFATAEDYKAGASEPYTTEAGDSQAYTTDHSITLGGLLPNTTYHIQARSKDRFGPVANSSDTTFTTTTLTPEIQDLSLTSANETSVVITWKTTVPTKRTVRLIAADTGEEAVYSDSSFLKTHNFEAQELSPSSNYVATITAIDEDGETVNSPPTPFSTITTSEPPKIEDVKVVSSLISGKVEKVQSIISWRTDKPSSSKVLYQQGVKTDDTAQEVVDESLKREHIIITSAFSPGQVYKYKVVSTDLAGNTAESQDFTLLTPKPQESVIDLIVNNVEEMFGFLKR